MALGISGLAAWLALTWRAQLKQGEHVLVLGASGVLGQIAMQSAKLLGAARVVAAARSPEGLARCLELGADAAVRLDEPDDLPAALGEAAEGRIDVVVDPVFGEPFVAAVQRRELRRPDRADRGGCGRRGDGAIGRDPRQDARDHGAHELRRAVAGQARGIPPYGRGGSGGRDAGGCRGAELAQVAEAWERLAAGSHRKLVLVP